MKMRIIAIVFLALSFQAFDLADAEPRGKMRGKPNQAIETVSKNLLPPTQMTSPENPFVLGPEDFISISVWGNEELTVQMPVRPDGRISFPLIGDIHAQGLTPAQLKDTITKKLRKYITDANVTVIVRTINSINISVAGQVREPGTYKVNRPITLMHLFSMAKGFTEKADLRKSYLLRNGKKLRIDIYALVREDNFSQNVWLKPNDFVFIHDNFESRINITGEVARPQVITYKEGMTIMDAILLAGGLTDVAKANGTKIYRKYTKGSTLEHGIQKINIELDKVIFEGDLSKNILLRQGDIIHVPRSFF
jgi:polysaccharide export outer membrane protein